MELLPLLLLPPPVYFKTLFEGGDTISLALGERYHKQTDRNRFRIYGPNNLQTLSVPVVHEKSHGQMALVAIDYRENWHLKHKRAIETVYRRSPFFEHYYHHIEPLFGIKYSLLAELNIEALHRINKALGVKVSIRLDMNYVQGSLPEKTSNAFDNKQYHQVFETRRGFVPNLSIIDLIFNEGPNALDFILA